MVSDVVHLDTTISQRIKHGEEEKEDEDTVSVSTTSTDNCDGAVVLQDAEDKAPCFQNIEVTNSSDVHFGNKTYYQGPVTIKQILYNNRDGEKLPVANGAPPQLAINDKCVVDNVNYANYNAGYTTDSAHPITTNGNTKLPNGIHNPFNAIRGTGDRKLTRTQWIIIGVGIAIAVLLGAVTLVLIFTLGKSNKNDSTTILGDADAQGEVTIVDRSSWVATDPLSVRRVTSPAPNIILSETRSNTCNETKDCIKYVRYLQNHHIEGLRKLDIIYNFLIGDDGKVYHGRGWKAQPEIAANCNGASLSIAFIGTYSNKKPSKVQVVAAKRLLRMGIVGGFISPSYKMVVLSQISGAQEDSGQQLLNEIKQWPNWMPNDYSKDITEREMFCKGR